MFENISPYFFKFKVLGLSKKKFPDSIMSYCQNLWFLLHLIPNPIKKKSSLIIAILKWNMAMSENATNMHARGREFKMGVVSCMRGIKRSYLFDQHISNFDDFSMYISSVNWFVGIRFTSSYCNGAIRQLTYRNLSNWIPPKVTRHSNMFSQWFLNLSYSPIKI